MVELSAYDLDRIFHALADSSRRAMLNAVADGRRTVTELARPFRMSLAATSKHIKVLERAGLVRREIEGRTHFVSLNAEALLSAEQWLLHYRRFWDDRLDALKDLLEQ